MKVSSNISAWKRSIEQAERIKVRMEPMAVEAILPNAQDFAKGIVKDAAFWREAAEEFLRLHVLPYLQKRFFALANDTAHWPRVYEYPDRLPGNDGMAKQGIAKGASFDRRMKTSPQGKRLWRSGNLSQGFVNLFAAISQHTVHVDERHVRIGLGPMAEILSLRLNEYMPTFGSKSTNSDLNYFFYAVEYGTGVKENVGGDQWVRDEGPTKDFARDGSWWLGQYAGEGVHFHGQKGFHLFYDMKTRERNEQLVQEIQEMWPKFFREYITNHPDFKGRIRAK